MLMTTATITATVTLNLMRRESLDTRLVQDLLGRTWYPAIAVPPATSPANPRGSVTEHETTQLSVTAPNQFAQ
jgi:hypothetical protein